ncbi:MAG TPA: hypothetical protein VLD19_16125, partial [Chitinophagaceae bacterium]|nr:hypothetical protein [Chitinophagaceae bacterium]
MLPTDSYTTHIEQLNQRLAGLEQRKNQVAWGRFLIVVLIALCGWWLYNSGILWIIFIIVALAAVFIRLVLLATDNKSAIAHVSRLLVINRQELDIAAGQYTGLPDGAQLLPARHDYAQDLDIFGRASLYQYMNRTVSQQGNATLAQWLLQPAAAEVVLQRQAAARELAPAYAWRQELQAYGIEEPISTGTERKVVGWLKEDNTYSSETALRALRWVYPVITLGVLASYCMGWLPSQLFWFLAIIFIAYSFYISKGIIPQYRSLDKIMKEIAVLSQSAACIEKADFKDAYLQQLQRHFLTNQLPASAAIKRLKAILDRFDYRLNPLVFVPLNAFLLWDLQLIFQLEKWRTLYKDHAAQWFTALGETEAINSIANLHFNQPGWVFASLDDTQHGTLDATALGHPLIPEGKRVCSSFSTRGEAKMALITGSNMAGKSTFLRSIGVNVVLAMMG